MSLDFEVEILPGGTDSNLIVYLSANDPNLNLNREKFLRPSFPLDPNVIKDLRSGNASFTVVQRVANDLSTWLMSNDMPGYLNAPISGAGPVRLILRIDRTLLEQMSDLPIELLRFKNEWVILRQGVSAIVHELPATPLPKQPSQSLPLKVLIVRSSPAGLPVKVPPAGPICNHIIKLAEDLGPNLVHVDLLSREVDSLEPGKSWDEFEALHLPALKFDPQDTPEEREKKEALKWREFRDYLLNRRVETLEPGTWDKLTTQLRKNSANYHILVYLGHGNHGNLYGSQDEKDKVGYLQFEKADGKSVWPISSGELQRELQNRQVPIPVVMLTGCLTAAEVDALDPEIRQQFDKDRPEWTLGSQGVAQRLVDSASGVQCAVGMRYQIETNSAFTFLQAFFESLLKGAPGNVEGAVRAGRWKLASPEYPPSWSAPVIFRTRGEEPMFKFIADLPKTYKLDRDDVRNQDVREAAWTALLQDTTLQVVHTQLSETENAIKRKVLDAQGALIMPELKQAAPGEKLEVIINLYGLLSAMTLKCKLSVSGSAATIVSLHSSQILRDQGFMLEGMTETGSSEINFSIKRQAGAAILPEGGILIAKLELGPAVPAKYTVDLSILETDPNDVAVRPINNVVLVPRA